MAEPILMSLRPEQLDLIWRGLKTHEFRRRFPQDVPARCFVYLTAPESRLAAVIDLGPAVGGTPQRIAAIAERDQPGTGVSVLAYLQGTDRAFALPILRVTEYPSVSIAELRRAPGGFHPPQTYVRLNRHPELLRVCEEFASRLPIRTLTVQSSVSDRYQYGVELTLNDEEGEAQFKSDLATVAELLGQLAQAIEPIGSRLVPGILAKPITDLLVQVLPGDLPQAEERLGRAGLQAIVLGRPARTMFRRYRPGSTSPDLHVHLVTPEAWHASSERAFYQLLQSRETVADAYSAAKRLALDLSGGDAERYGRLKSQFIEWVLEAIRDTEGPHR